MNVLVEEAARHWPFVSPLLRKPATEAEYDELAALLDDVLTISGGDPDHDLAGLASAMGDRLASYDGERRPMPPVGDAEALSYLMREHGLELDGLPEVGTVQAVADLLSGAARLDERQARALGERFALPADFFRAG